MAAITLALLTAGILGATSAHAQSAPAGAVLKLPFPAGSVWRPIQGYNGGTHVPGPEFYALDLVRDGGVTAGAPVIAPAAGSLWFAQPPGAANGCVSILIDNGGGLIVQLCHIILNRVMQSNERIAPGAPLGVIGDDGRVGNNGIAHVHVSLHRTPDYGVTRIPAPFTIAAGLLLDGNSLPADGSRNQYGCPGGSCPGRFTSSNGSNGATAAPVPSSSAPAPVTAPSSVPAPVSPPSSAAPNPPAIVPVPAAPAVPPTPARPANAAPPSSAVTVALAFHTGGQVLVTDAGDCVRAHDGPSLASPSSRCLRDLTPARIAEGPVYADGYLWWRLDGLGWTVSAYLTAVRPEPAVGARATVAAGGDCLNLHAAPASTAVIACLPDGAAVRISAGPTQAAGATWWQVDGRGWVAAEFLNVDD